MASNDAEEYVEAIMSSQLLTKVSTPVRMSGRKRHLSDPCEFDSAPVTHIKKQKINVAKRKLYNGKAENRETASVKLLKDSVNSDDVKDNDADKANEASGINVDDAMKVLTGDKEETTSAVSTTIVETLLANLAADMNMQFNAINERMDRLETGLEKRITQKVTQVLDKRVSVEISKINKSVEKQVKNVKADIAAEFRTDFEEVNKRIDSVSNAVGGQVSSDNENIALNIVIRDLPEQANENTLDKVNKLIKDGLKVTDVECDRAIRKGQQSRNNRVIIAHFKTFEEKRKVMIQKKNLKNSDRYRKVFIHHDQSMQERIMSDNFRTVLHTLRQHGLIMRGSRVVQKDRSAERQEAGGRANHNFQYSNSEQYSNSDNNPRVSNFQRDSYRGSSFNMNNRSNSYNTEQHHATRGAFNDSNDNSGANRFQNSSRRGQNTTRGRGPRNHQGRGVNSHRF